MRSRKRGRDDTPPDVSALKSFVEKEDETIRSKAKEVLNQTLIKQTEAITALEVRLEELTSYEEALECGIVSELRKELHAIFKMGNRLETWLNTYTPPLASGGNAGISGEVQEGIYGNIHALTAGSSEALVRTLQGIFARSSSTSHSPSALTLIACTTCGCSIGCLPLRKSSVLSAQSAQMRKCG